MSCLLSHSFCLDLCSFMFLFVPWYFLEKPGMEVSQIQFNFWIFFSNAICALALNFSIFLVIGRTGAVTIRVAGVLKDWILIALSTIVFPESTITGLNIIGYAIGIYFNTTTKYCRKIFMAITFLDGLTFGFCLLQHYVVLWCTTTWRWRTFVLPNLPPIVSQKELQRLVLFCFSAAADFDPWALFERWFFILLLLNAGLEVGEEIVWPTDTR